MPKLLAGVAVLSFVVLPAHSLPENCVLFSRNNHVYCIEGDDTIISWSTAKTRAESSTLVCPGDGGHSADGVLATFATREEADWVLDPNGDLVQSLIYSPGGANYAWIAGMQMMNEPSTSTGWNWIFPSGEREPLPFSSDWNSANMQPE